MYSRAMNYVHISTYVRTYLFPYVYIAALNYLNGFDHVNIDIRTYIHMYIQGM